MKKILPLFLVMLLVIQNLVMGVSVPSVHSQEKEFYREIEYLTSEGHSIPNDGTQEITEMKVNWSLEEVNIQLETPYTMEVPEPLEVNQASSGDLQTEGNVIGTYKSVEPNKLTVILNEKAKEHPSAHGAIVIPVSNKDNLEEEPIKEVPQSNQETVPNDPTEKQTTNDEPKPTQETEGKSPAVQKVATANAIIEENILTSASLKIEDKQGNIQEKVDKNSLVSVKYEWALKNGHGYKEGDIFNFLVPEELEVYEELNRYEMRFSGETIGYFSVNKQGEASIEFTKFIEEFSNISGTLEILTELNESLIINEEKTIQITPIQGKETITIPFNYITNDPAVFKNGAANRSYNAETITWTVDLNKKLESLKNAKLIDPIQDGQELNPSSITLYHLDTKVNGETSKGSEVSPDKYSVEKTTDGKDFVIVFIDEIKSAYQLVYESSITDTEKTAYSNKATLTSEEKEIGSADASVNVKRGQPLEKKVVSYDSATQSITWEIQYNYNQKSISMGNAMLEDFFNDTQELVTNSFKVEEITIDQDGNQSGSKDYLNYVVGPTSKTNKNGFTFKFNENINAAYKITYQTKAISRVYDPETVVNEVTTGGITKQASQGIGQQILFKNHGTPDYKTKLISWTIEFNKDSQIMKNLELKDVFTNKGLTFQANTLTIKTGGNALQPDVDYTLTENGDGFDITFLKEISTPHSLTYTTAFDFEKRSDTSKNYLSNQVTLNWKDQTDQAKTKVANTNFTPDSYTQSNGFKNGSYDATNKTIKWNVGVNYNLKQLNELRVEDYIQGNQKLLEDSFAVYSMNLTGGGNGTNDGTVVPVEEYDVNLLEKNAAEEPGFEIIFKKPINSPYKIVYKTSLNDLNIVENKYENTATLYDGTIKQTDLSGTVSIPNGGTYLNKSGVQNGKIIDWKVDINFAQSTINNVKITDDPSENQALIKDSFKLYETEVAKNGGVQKKAELEEGIDYTLNITDDPNFFTIDFEDEVNRPYILEYQSLILEKPGNNVTNDVSFNGEKVDETKNVSFRSIQVKRTVGMGDGKGEVGSLKVTKVDSQTGALLEGAKFSLTDDVSKVTIGTVETGEDGTAQFGRLLYGDYTLTEVSAPQGYLKGMQSAPITINQPYESGNADKKGNEITVQNTEITQHVELTKRDDETNEVLVGAVFELRKENNELVASNLTTGKDGKILVEDLQPGAYYFQETAPPAGYELDSTKRSFTINKDQTTITKLNVVNSVIKGKVEVLKVSETETGAPLEGASFNLLNAQGETLQNNLNTDENGSILIEDLRPGKYELKETKAPFGHDLLQQNVSFEIEKNQEKTLQLTIVNEQSTSSVELTKKGEDDKLLEGVTFDLTDEDKKLLQSDLMTDKDGKLVVNNLKPGNYYLIEKESIDGYVLGEEKEHKFTITLGQASPSLVSVVNEFKTGTVQLTKLGEKGDQDVLEGAIYRLLDSNKNVIRENLKTDNSGKILISGLKPNTYHFEEMEAPFGHKLDKTLVTFAIPFNPQKTVEVIAKNERNTSGVTLQKKGEDGNLLEGVVFDLRYKNGEIVTGGKGLRTNNQGIIDFAGLKPGNYEFVETSTNAGYVLSSQPTPFEIVLGQKDVTKVNVINQLITGSVQMKKIGEMGNEDVLQGAEFNLVNSSGTIVRSGLVTNEKGLITVDHLKPGNYQFIETKAPFGHNLDATPVNVKVDFNPNSEPVRVVKLNSRSTQSVELVKKGEDGESLKGVKFDLRNEAGSPITKDLTTDQYGKLVVDHLKPGRYQFVEIQSIPGYDLNSTPVYFTITLGQDKKTQVEIINQLTRGSVQLTKTGEEGNTLADAEFKLIDSTNQVIQSKLTTNKTGNVTINNLKPGEYKLVETKAPKGYVLNDTPIHFVIEKNQKEMLKLSFKNNLILGNLKVVKVDSETNQRLKGASFNVLTNNGKVIQTVTTNKHGEAKVTDLKPGKYSMRETKAPNGYVISNSAIPFNIELGQEKELVMVVKNNPEKENGNPGAPTPAKPAKPADPSVPLYPSNPVNGVPSSNNETTNNMLPKTGEEWLRLMLYSGFFFITIGAGVMLTRRKQNIER